MVSVLPGTRITALLDQGKISGSAGCNNYGGAYIIDGNSISIGPLASTEMMCADPEGVMEQEAQYLSAMDSVAKYQVIANRLEMISKSGELAAMFSVAKPTSLVDTPWQIVAYNNGREAVVSVINDTEITALFAEGNVSGSAGCNDYNASYELDGENITIAPAVTTRKFCEEPEGVMEQETEFLTALLSANAYQLDGQRLDMFSADGVRALNAQDANSDSQ
jgi:heat shock protein HslJ